MNSKLFRKILQKTDSVPKACIIYARIYLSEAISYKDLALKMNKLIDADFPANHLAVQSFKPPSFIKEEIKQINLFGFLIEYCYIGFDIAKNINVFEGNDYPAAKGRGVLIGFIPKEYSSEFAHLMAFKGYIVYIGNLVYRQTSNGFEIVPDTFHYPWFSYSKDVSIDYVIKKDNIDDREELRQRLAVLAKESWFNNLVYIKVIQSKYGSPIPITTVTLETMDQVHEIYGKIYF